jgi:hypothetical protein
MELDAVPCSTAKGNEPTLARESYLRMAAAQMWLPEPDQRLQVRRPSVQ